MKNRDNAKTSIVLVHGAFADGSSWRKVISVLEKNGRTVTALQIPLKSLTDDVATTKRAIDAQKDDVILVGHSYGGLIMQLYASTYPQQVAGLVLVESVHADQFRYPELHVGPIPPICQALAPFGIVRLFGLAPGYIAEYPPTAQPAAKAQIYQTRFCQTASDEYAALDESFAQVRAAQHPLGHLPLVVLTHGLPYLGSQGERDWQALQRDLASLSSDSRSIIATRSEHYIQLEQPDLVLAAIKQVLTGTV